jgi:hypothetical protein
LQLVFRERSEVLVGFRKLHAEQRQTFERGIKGVAVAPVQRIQR